MKSMTSLRNFIVHCGRTLGDHPFLVNKKTKDVGVDPPSIANNQQMETAKTDAKEAYMTIALLSVLNCHMYGPLMNELHNAFGMGRLKYPNTTTSAYNLAIKWKSYTCLVAVPKNDVVVVVDEVQYGDIHAI